DVPGRFRRDTRRGVMEASLERYSRQMRFYGVGDDGQRRLLDSHVTLCGCGALGTVLANALVRGGVGHLRLIDRDFIETNNLQRQVLFDEHDVEEDLALEVVGLDKVAVDEAQVADAAADEGVGEHGAQRAAAAQRHVAVQEPALAVVADAVEAHLPAVALQRSLHYASPCVTPKSARNV